MYLGCRNCIYWDVAVKIDCNIVVALNVVVSYAFPYVDHNLPYYLIDFFIRVINL